MSTRTVFTLLEEAVERYGSAPALHQPLPGGKHRSYNWVEYRTTVQEIACGLRSLGIQRGDIVGLHSETRAEFYMADLGVISNGSIAAALYTSYPVHEQVRTLEACGPKAVFVENPKSLKALREAASSLHVTWILMSGTADGTMTLEELAALGRKALDEDPTAFDRIHAEVRPEDHAILYLTSGATGEPKMGLVSHRAILANADMGPEVIELGPEDATIAFLPSAHITQRFVMEIFMIRMGVPVWFSEGLSRLPHEMRSVRPTFLVAPPRVWERIFASISTEIRKRGTVSRRLFYTAVGVGAEAYRYTLDGKPLPIWISASMKLFDKVMFRKIRERLGGRVRVAVSGAAPLGKELAAFYAAIGMPLVEGYGLTEGGVLVFNPVSRPKLGSIGKPLPGVELKIAEDGELLVKSPTLFDGYYKDPEATAAVLRDGWLYTGDIAEIDDEGYVYITGRKKEVIVASNGKKIYPARVETLFKVEPIVNQVFVLGDRMPYAAALFTLNMAAVEAIIGAERAKSLTLDDIAKLPEIQKEVKEAVQRANKQLAPFEQIRKFRILDREFTIDSGEMTPTMKLRRAKVLENFQPVISDIYAGKEEAAL